MRALNARIAKALLAILVATSAVAALWVSPAAGATVGDFDNNGIEDLAVGVPGEDVGPRDGPEVNNAGEVDVFYGQAAGLTEAGGDRWTQDSSQSGTRIKDVAEGGDRFGSSVAAGDVNGDGFDDLAVGVPGEDVGATPKANAGAAHVILGSSTGLVTAGNAFITIDPESGDRFGTAVAIADMFGGPEADLAVGGPGEDNNRGRVNRFVGGTLNPFGTVLDSSTPGDLAGSALATGQFGTAGGAGTGLSGKQDLAVGVPGAISGAGVVDVYRFGDIGSAFSQRFDESSLSRTIEPGDHFGAALAAGNFGAGSLDDLAIGAPQEDIESVPATDAGVVGVLYGKNNTLVTAGSQVIDQENAGLGTIETGDQFGAALATGDFGKSSVADLAIGSPTEDIGSGPGAQLDAGVIGFIYGDSTNGLTNAGAESRAPQPNFNYGPPEGGELGASLAAGNFGSGSRADLAAGIPLFPQFPSFPQDSGYGMVGVLYGRADGIAEGVSSPDLTLLDQLTSSVDDREGCDAFGAALAPRAGRSIVTSP
jgi:hypothetical protein